MKYLSKRDNFLNNQTGIKKYEVINETTAGAGPFANDLGWHDSLLGRLINHAIRKAQVKVGLVKIKSVIGRLKESFDALLAEGIISNLDEESQELIKKLTLYSFFYELKESVKNGDELEKIKSLTDAAISKLGDRETKEKLGDFEDKDIILKELEDFREFLNQFEEEEEEQVKEISQEDLDKLMLSNLTSLLNIMKLVGEKEVVTKTKEVLDKSNIKLGGYYLRKNSQGEITLLRVSSLDKNQKGQPLEKGVISGNFYDPLRKRWMPTQNPATIASMFKEVRVGSDNILNKEDITSFTNSIKSKEPIEAIKVKATSGTTPSSGVLTSESLILEDQSIDVPKEKLKKSINLLIKNDKGLSITIETLTSLIDNFKNKSESTEGKNSASFIVNNLYKEIFSCMKGRRSKTVSEPDKLTESFEILSSDRNKIPVMGELIAKFAKRSSQFEEGELYTKLGNVGKYVHEFNISLKDILNSGIGEPEYNKESIKERILSYEGFLLIKEADEDVDDKQATVTPKQTMSSRIQDYFDEKCKGVKSFVIEKTEIDKINKNMDEISKDKEKNKEFVIDGMDPVIEIVKLFNKAYKIFTVSYITKRTASSGGVGVTTSAEYTAFGGASSDGRQGPYRNNKIYDQWESAVNDIFKDRKYQHIFLPSTRLRIAKVPNPTKPEDYEYREKAGANLRKFMLDIMDGENLYKTSNESGKQKDFINKYFGDIDDKTQEGLNKAGDKDSEKLQKEISELPTTKLKFTKSSEIKDKIKENSVLSLTATNKDGKEIQRSIFIRSISGGKVYLYVSNSFGKFKKYISGLDGKKEFDMGNFSGSSLDSKYTMISVSDFNLLLENNKINIKSVDGDRNVKDDVLTITGSYWLTDDKQSIFSANGDQLKSIIESDGVKPNPETPISSAPDSDSIKITKSE